MIRLTIDAAEELRKRYATIEDLAFAAEIATATAGNARARRGIGTVTVKKIARLLDENPDDIITWLTPDEERIQILTEKVRTLQDQVLVLQNRSNKI